MASWQHELERKVAAGQSDLASELSEGAALLGVASLTVEEGLAAEAGDRSELTVARRDARGRRRLRARDASAPGTSSSRARGAASRASRSCCRSSPSSASTSLYLTPVHPIGRTHRKGRNNAPDARGGRIRAARGRSAARPAGTPRCTPTSGARRSSTSLTARAAELGIAIALDFAMQCSPDHPWLREHPDWFYRRPDGTLKYAENPPKRYQDIYNLNFDTRGLARALGRAARRHPALGRRAASRVFRVDNPHTKPIAFWEWLIAEVQREHPETVFLAEAFTRPALMAMLAKAGFSQSYTYFTWRNTKAELTST